MARGEDGDESSRNGGLFQVNGNNGHEYAGEPPSAKRFCDTKRFSTDSGSGDRRLVEADSASRRFAEPRAITSYPHSMPASPTMLDPR